MNAETGNPESERPPVSKLGSSESQGSLSGETQAISMREKVRSLRIEETNGAKRPGNRVLLMASVGWCLAMAATGTAILLGYKAYRSPGLAAESGVSPKTGDSDAQAVLAKPAGQKVSNGTNQSTSAPVTDSASPNLSRWNPKAM